MLKSGDVIGGTYVILQEIGKGGVGIIYLGYHQRLQKKIVIKKIKDNFVGKMNERGEVDLLKNLHHMHLPQVYDFIQMGNQIYTVMDFIEGNSLQYYLNHNQRFSEQQMVFWMNQLCDVIGYLHHQRVPIIHSDIKPDNIMIRPDGNICLIDFNISIGDEQTKGISGYTQRYASPEQIMKHHLYKNRQNYQSVLVDTRSDIYSLGVTLYHALTGIQPPQDYRMIQPLSQMQLPYSPNLIRIIQKAMNPSMAARYQSIDDMKYDLVNIRRDIVKERKTAFRRNLLILLGVCIVAVTAAAGVIGYQVMQTKAFQQEYEDLVELAESDDYDAVIEDGLQILNNSKYQRAMKKENVKQADILYMIANCYFEQDEYGYAVAYYEEAVLYNAENPEYFRDYAIALARKGELKQAEDILEQAIDLGLKEDHIYLVQAEISLAKGDYADAIGNFQRAITMTEDEYLQSRAYLLCGRAYREMGNLPGEIEILEEAKTQVEAAKLPAVIRALGAAYLRQISQLSEDSEKEPYIENAIECYQILIEGVSPTFHDYMNLAILYEMEGNFEKEAQLLKDMEKLYPEDYRIYMRYGLMRFSEESRKNGNDRDYSDVEKYYKIALEYYDQVKNSGASDDTMEYLESIVKELHDKGWL